MRNFSIALGMASVASSLGFCSQTLSPPNFILVPMKSTTVARDVSLAFLNRNVEKPDYFETNEEIVVLKHPDDISPVERSHPSIDQDARWMEQEGTTELLSVFVVIALVGLAEFLFKFVNEIHYFS